MNSIGFYQLDNLIKNRIPFLLVNLDLDLSSWYDSIYKQHYLRQQRLVSLIEVSSLVQTEKIPNDFPIVILCKTGVESNDAAHKLTQLGYTNVYFVDGGIAQMMTDRQ